MLWRVWHGFQSETASDSLQDRSLPVDVLVLYRFTGGSDGRNPNAGDLTFDQAGNVYGTAILCLEAA